MDSIFAIIVLVIIFGLIEKLSKGAKHGPRSAPARPKPPEPSASPAREALADAIAAFSQMDGEAEPEMKGLPLGESFQDDDGCLGGSLGAHSEEGESRSEHAEHLRRQAAEPVPKTAPPQRAAAVRGLSAADMRQAVILSEILDKPKALRRR